MNNQWLGMYICNISDFALYFNNVHYYEKMITLISNYPDNFSAQRRRALCPSRRRLRKKKKNSVGIRTSVMPENWN